MSYRILLITDHFPPQIGGAAVSADRAARAMAGRGHVVHVLHLTPDLEPGMIQSEREGDRMVHRLGALELPDLTMQLAESIVAHLHERVGFDLFHGHFLVPAGYLATYFAKRFGAQSFVSVRGNDVDRGIFRAEQFPFVLWTLQHAGGIGCVSRELIDKCRAFCDRDDIDFLPNPVDATVFRPLPRDEALLCAINYQGEALLGFVGELRFKKGTYFVLEAFRTVREQRPAKLLLIGGLRNEDKSLLRRYLRQYPTLREDIHIIEYVQDRETLARYYNLLDIVLSPSLWDGMPNSVLEAMACARVVLASDVGGIRDVITPGKTGLLIGTHELDRLGEGCLEILEAGEEARREIGRQAREYVLQHHHPDGEAAHLHEIYTRLLT